MESKSWFAKLNKHSLMMIACCALPLLALSLVGVIGPNLQSDAFPFITLLCPLMMVFTMFGTGHNHDHQQHGGRDHAAPGSCHTQPPPGGDRDASLPVEGENRTRD